MTAPDSFGQGIDLWQMSDAPSIPDAIAALADGVIPRGVLRFASASARGAALSGDAAPVEGMVTYLLDVNRLEMYDGSAWVTPPQTLTSTSSGLSVASGFSLIDFAGFREGRSTTLDIYLTRTGAAIQSTNGNIADTVCCTVPSGWRPTNDTITSCFDNGIVHGGFVIGTDGICTLRTASDDIGTSTNLRLHISFLKTT
jgi:hypothetical protein